MAIAKGGPCPSIAIVLQMFALNINTLNAKMISWQLEVFHESKNPLDLWPVGWTPSGC